MQFSKPGYLLLALVLLACGSSGSGNPGTGGSSAGGSSGSSTNGGTGGTSGTSGAGGGGGLGAQAGSGGGVAPTADYKKCVTDADCPGGDCQELPLSQPCAGCKEPLSACVYPIVEATSCHDGGNIDECCKSADCGGGKCVEYPPNPECPTGQTPHNVCTQGYCACPTTSLSYCVPPGTYGYDESFCLQSFCFADSDCDAIEPGGKCLPVFGQCGKALGVGCVLPVIGCQSNADCAQGETCVLELGVAKCFKSGF